MNFSVDVIEMGPDGDGGLCADPEVWPNGGTQWDIVVMRHRSGGINEPIVEIEVCHNQYRIIEELREVLEEAVDHANENDRIIL